jgi:4-hydroxy-tetrahydrodipicolinate synthase
MIQDFNPGGPTISPDFIAKASGRHANISYFKLEEPMIIDKLVQIRDKVGDSVGILGGWGGYYMLESIPFGICGIVPGVPICDLLDRVFRARQVGDDSRAYDLFGSILPYIAFSLQDFELFLQVEKRLMMRRGLFASDRCRPLTRTISEAVSNYIDELIEHVIRVIERESLSITL